MLQYLHRATEVDAPAASVISVRAVAKSFGGGSTVLKGLDLDVAPRSAVALIGANGTGKSTLLKSLIRLHEVSAGTVRVLGQEVTSLSRGDLMRLRARVGFVFQRHNLVPRLCALSNVVHGVQSRERGPRTWTHALARAETRDEAMQCLDAVGLSAFALQRADSLSGGQAQRVAIARMLMQRPELVLADEPDASLDPQTGDAVMRLLSDLCKTRGCTLVFVSHRLEHAQRYADRIVGLSDGKVALDVVAREADVQKLRAFFSEPSVALT